MTKHERFIQRLKASSKGVMAFASWLNGRGHRVEIGPTRCAPTPGEHALYVDDGDLFIVTRDRVEIKTMGFNFTSRGDWPHPVVFVSSKAQVERAHDVYRWVLLSHDLTHAAIIHPLTRPQWSLEERVAKNTGNVEVNYACPLELVMFCRIGDEA